MFWYPKHDFLESSGTPAAKHEIAQKVFVHLTQFYKSFCTPIKRCFDDTEAALEIQVSFLCSRSASVLSLCFNIEQINAFYLMFLYRTYRKKLM